MHSEPGSDPRLQALRRWLVAHFGARAFTLAAASADASFRRYFRVSFAGAGEASLIAMDALPAKEDCRRFVHVARLFAAAGAHTPRVEAQNVEEGFLLLEDLGCATYLDRLAGEAAADASKRLYPAAIDALIAIQLASRPGELPPYDEALLRRELNLFPEWYLAKRLGVTLAEADMRVLEDAFRVLLANALAQPCAFVHRDYHSRNLMVCAPLPGVLDFQDAVYGPISYDLASLLKDAYIRWDEERVIDWCVRYWEKARKAGLPVRGDFAQFYTDFEWMGVQRHLKVAGIFTRLAERDGKERYLADLPRVLAYLHETCARYRELGPLAGLLERLHGRDASPGCTPR